MKRIDGDSAKVNKLSMSSNNVAPLSLSRESVVLVLDDVGPLQQVAITGALESIGARVRASAAGSPPLTHIVSTLTSKLLPEHLRAEVSRGARLVAPAVALDDLDALQPPEPAKKRARLEEEAKETRPPPAAAPAAPAAAPSLVLGKGVLSVSRPATEADALLPSISDWSSAGEGGSVLVLTTAALSQQAATSIAAFDLDGTLVSPKGKNVHPKDRYDWRWAFPGVPVALKKLHAEGKKLVVFTNQLGAADKPDKREAVTGKIVDIIRTLGVPMQVFMSIGSDEYRKPRTGMWRLFVERHNGGAAVDASRSFYCGDAAGREAPKEPGARKDHSAVDLKFALNVFGRQNQNACFRTSESQFAGKVDLPFDLGFDPVARIEACEQGRIQEGWVPATAQPEMLIIVGPPGSSKTTFCERTLIPLGYVWVNNDTLKSKEKCLKVAREGIQAGKSVVIDNTNPTAEARAPYIALAKGSGIPVRALVFEAAVNKDLAWHLHAVRVSAGGRSVPSVAFHSFWSKYEQPEEKEGFQAVLTINLVPKGDQPHLNRFKEFHV